MTNSSALWARSPHLLLLAGALILSRPEGGAAQSTGARDAYYRTVSDHFRVPLREVAILGDWDLKPEEIPVVLFVSTQAGVSPDVVVGLRKSGRPWVDVARQVGVGTMAFHVPLPEDAPLGALSESLGQLRGRPISRWGDVRLTDDDLVALVNFRILSHELGVSLDQVIRAWDESGDFLACHQRVRSTLATRGLPYKKSHLPH